MEETNQRSMEDTEWEKIASKYMDSLEQEQFKENVNNALQESNDKIGCSAICNEVGHAATSTSITKEHISLERSQARPEQIINKMGESICEMIMKLDPKHNLTIHGYIKQVNDDPVVSEYVRKLLDLQFVPSEPSVLELKYYAAKNIPSIKLSSECQKKCILMFASYFKCCEIKLKLKRAEYEKTSLFEVSAFPEFLGSQILFTITGHERMATLRNCLCTQMQRAAATENQFVMELLLIRICYCLMKNLEQCSKQDNFEKTELIKAYFVWMYLRVKFEYETKYSKEDEVKLSTSHLGTEHNLPDYPSWRVEERSPPVFFEPDWSVKILDQVKKQNLKQHDMLAAIKLLCEQNKI